MAYARFFLHDPKAPKPNRKIRLGANVLLIWEDKLLLEYRRDSDLWGLIGGGVKGAEPEEKALIREVWEETGIRLGKEDLVKKQVFAEPGRIVAYRDGTVHRMICLLYEARLKRCPTLKPSRESRQLRFFTGEELKSVPIAPTHIPMIELFAPGLLADSPEIPDTDDGGNAYD